MNSWTRYVTCWVIFFIMWILLSACTASGGVETNKPDEIADSFLFALTEQYYEEATDLFYYPEEFTPESERDSMLKALLIVSDELGSVESYKKSTSSLYLSVGLMTASQTYWQKYPPFSQQVYDVQYRDKGPGYIVFQYSRIQAVPVIYQVLFGLPVTASQTQPTINQILVRLHNEVKT